MKEYFCVHLGALEHFDSLGF